MSKDLSIVVQGPLNKDYIFETVGSLKINFEYSEIILSTYNDQPELVKELKNIYEDIKFVFNDHQKLIVSEHNNRNAINMISTTRLGILQTTRKYVLKLRSDLIITDFKIVYKFLMRMENDPHPKVTVLLARNPFRNKYYYIDDWLQLGLKKELHLLYELAFTNSSSFINKNSEIILWSSYIIKKMNELNKYTYIKFLREFIYIAENPSSFVVGQKHSNYLNLNSFSKKSYLTDSSVETLDDMFSSRKPRIKLKVLITSFIDVIFFIINIIIKK